MGTDRGNDEASRWLAFAHDDLAAARSLVSDHDIPPRHACYFAQQAAEKALKAMLLRALGTYPRSHDLDYLRNLLPESWAIHARMPKLGVLTEWLVEARYPGNWPEASQEDAIEAIRLAAEVLQALNDDWQSHAGQEA